jgi:putative transposase
LDDSPYAKAQLETLKYQPDFPARFGYIEDATAPCQAFFAW